MGLQQNGGIQYVAIEYHNRFGTNMLKAQWTISSCSYQVWKGKMNFDYPNLGLERSIWNS